MSGSAGVFQPGRVVLCTAGRDKDRFYVVVKWQEGRAFIADGKARKLAAPKAKNPRHLQKTNHTLCLDEAATDKKLRAALAPLNERQQAASEPEGGNRLV